MKEFNRVTGIKNEENAVNYIKNVLKYKIIARNYKNKIGEIDIIAKDKLGTIIFVEVKYRSSAKFGLGRDAVDERKMNKIRLTATQFLVENMLYSKCNIRFDVIDILDDNITHIENAF